MENLKSMDNTANNVNKVLFWRSYLKRYILSRSLVESGKVANECWMQRRRKKYGQNGNVDD